MEVCTVFSTGVKLMVFIITGFIFVSSGSSNPMYCSSPYIQDHLLSNLLAGVWMKSLSGVSEELQ